MAGLQNVCLLCINGLVHSKAMGCLFASGHSRPAVDTFKRLTSAAVLFRPLTSKAWAEHQIGKSIAI